MLVNYACSQKHGNFVLYGFLLTVACGMMWVGSDLDPLHSKFSRLILF